MSTFAEGGYMGTGATVMAEIDDDECIYDRTLTCQRGDEHHRPHCDQRLP